MLEERGEVVSNLCYALLQGTKELGTALPLLKQMLEEKSWKRRIEPITGKIVEFQRFTDFMQASPPEGLGVTFEQLWDLCYDDPVLLDLLDKEVVQGPGAKERIRKSNKNVDSSTQVAIERPTGTSRQAGLRRLRKQAPELHQQVLNGEISVNAALIKAGLRTKQITVFVEPGKAAEAILRAFQPEDLVQLMTNLIIGLRNKTTNSVAYCLAISNNQIHILREILEEVESSAKKVELSVAADHQPSLVFGYPFDEVMPQLATPAVLELERLRRAAEISNDDYLTSLKELKQVGEISDEDFQILSTGQKL